MSTAGPQSSETRSPVLSIVLPVKNAMPHLRKAIEALCCQTYRNFEVLVQDGGSTDDTLPYLESVRDLPRIDIASEPDAGVGQAYNRGIKRANGEYLCFAAADEYLDHNALERGVAWINQYPSAVAIYGGVRLIDESDRIAQVFIPPKFDLLRFIHNEVFTTPAAAFFNRARLGSCLYYDETLKTCPDYDFWIRVGSTFAAEDLTVVPEAILSARRDRSSMSYRIECFEQFANDKLSVLDRYVRRLADQDLASALRLSARAGILTWVAECIFGIEGVSPAFIKWSRAAAAVQPKAQRLRELGLRSEAFEIDNFGSLVLQPKPQPEIPSDCSLRVSKTFAFEDIRTDRGWVGAKVERGENVLITTTPKPWGYSAILPIEPMDPHPDNWYWAKLNVRVISGEVAIGLHASDGIFNERVLSPADGGLNLFIRVNRPAAAGIMVRNGPDSTPSVMEVSSATVVYAPRQGW